MNPNYPESCPHCNVSLLDTPIPEEYIKNYAKGSTHFKREIGMEFPELYDGIWYYMCPDCKGEWGGVRALRLKGKLNPGNWPY